MKTKGIASLAFIATFLVLVACDKSSSVEKPATLQASRTHTIKIGDSVTVHLKSAGTDSAAIFSVSPEGNAQIIPDGNSAVILFNAKGIYQVTATNGGKSASLILSVNDSTLAGRTGLPVLSSDTSSGQLTATGFSVHTVERGEDSIFPELHSVSSARYDTLIAGL